MSSLIDFYPRNVHRMTTGTKVLTAGKTGTSRQLFSNSEINSLLGVSNSSNGNTAVMVSNGCLLYTSSVVVDQEPNALVDLLDLANEGENPRVTKAMLDSYIDSEEVDIDELMEKTKDFLSKANATKKAVKEILKEYEEQLAKKKAQEL